MQIMQDHLMSCFANDQQGINSCKMFVETAEEEVLCMERSIFGNVRPAGYTGPPKTPTRTKDHERPSDVLRFASDYQGISSCKMFVEVAEEEAQCIARSTFENVRPAANTRPPKRPTKTASQVGPSHVHILCL